MKWDFTLLDKMSGPADDIAKSVSAASVAMKNAAPPADKLASSIDKTAAATEKLTRELPQLAPIADKTKKAAESAEVALLKQKKTTLELALEVPRLKRNLESLNKELNPDKPKKFTLEMGNLFHSFAGLRQNDAGQFTFNVAEGIYAVVGAAEHLASVFSEITGKALEVAAAGEKTKRAFNLDLGATGGKELLSYLDQVRNKSRGLYTQEQLTGLTAPLAQHGIGLPDIKRFLPAALSVEARGGNAGAALGALGDIRTNRSIGTGTLEALNLGSFADKKAIASQLGKQFGFGGSYAQRNPEAILSAVSERLQYQPQKADQVVRTLLAALAKREGGALGNEAAGTQQGTAATLTRLQNLPQNLLEKLTSSGQLDNLVNSLDRFVNIMSGPEGKSAIDGFAKLIDMVASFVHVAGNIIGDKVPNGTLNERGQAQVTQLPFDAAHDQLSLTARIDKWLGRGGAGSSDEQAQNGRPANGVLSPPAVKDIGDSFATSFFDKWTSLSTTSAGITPSKSADDFIWRNGTAIEIDPHDTVVGYKRGGSLGVGDGGGSGGGGMMLQIASGAIQINGTGMNAGEVADEVLSRIEKAPGRLLLSALDQFAAESGAA